MTIEEAHRALDKAREKVTAAERERDEASADLDRALADRGWHRAAVAAGPGTRLYEKLGGNLVGLDAVLEHELAVARHG